MENIQSLDIKNKIIEYCKNLGLDTIGFTKCRVFEELQDFFKERNTKGLQNEFEEKIIDKRVNPFSLYSEGKTIISIAFPYLFEMKNSKGAYFSLYTRGRDYHHVVSEYLREVCSFIESMGGKSQYFVDSNALPERYIALLAGVGFIGKNNMLITEKYGSYVFLGEIMTDLELESDSPVANGCGECISCIKSCPEGALGENGDCNICLSYITQKKHISDEEILKFKGRMFGCDTCQLVCPYNKTVVQSKLKEFIPFDYMSNVELEKMAEMSSSMFKEMYALSSCGWRGRNVLQRNALINLVYMNGPESLAQIDAKGIGSPYVKDYYHRLLKIFQL